MNPAWTAALAAFLEDAASVRRLSPLTVAAYRRELDLLARAIADGPQAADAALLRRELARAHAGGLAARSLARRLAAWRSFFQWAVRQGRLAANPAVGLRAPRAPRRLPGVLGVEAASRLMQAADPGHATASPDSGAEAAVLQDNALFELLYSSGLRVAELVRLDLRDLDLAQGLVTVLGKGQRRRTVPVGAAARDALQRWLAVRGEPGNSGGDALFLGQRGARLGVRSVQKRLARRGRALGLAQPVHPHLLRHSCASHVLQSSGDLRAVQELLGHVSIASTQIYTHLDFQHLAAAYDAAHPRARKTSQGEQE